MKLTSQDCTKIIGGCTPGHNCSEDIRGLSGNDSETKKTKKKEEEEEVQEEVDNEWYANHNMMDRAHSLFGH